MGPSPGRERGVGTNCRHRCWPHRRSTRSAYRLQLELFLMSVTVAKRERGGERFNAAIQDQAVLQRAQASVEASRWHVVGAPATKNDAKILIRDLTNFIHAAFRTMRP